MNCEYFWCHFGFVSRSCLLECGSDNKKYFAQDIKKLGFTNKLKLELSCHGEAVSVILNRWHNEVNSKKFLLNKTLKLFLKLPTIWKISKKEFFWCLNFKLFFFLSFHHPKTIENFWAKWKNGFEQRRVGFGEDEVSFYRDERI